MRRQPAREENERHDDEADDGADDQTEKQRELIFALAEAVHRTPEVRQPSGGCRPGRRLIQLFCLRRHRHSGVGPAADRWE